MIIVAISGGVGNQLFQYAAGRYLADRQKCKLVLDYSWYESRAAKKVTHREFILDYLIDSKGYDLAITGLVPKVIRLGLMVLSLLSPFFASLKYTRLNEKEPFVFSSKFDDLFGNVFINGFWQVAHYTENINLSKFSKKFIDECEEAIGVELLDSFKKYNTISLNVRRGNDYGEDLQVCSPTYYINSVKKIASFLDARLSNRVFVFSDNLEWCKQELKFDIGASVVFIEDFAGVDSWKTDLYLSALCQSHVISNSTFAWWAAALGQRKSMTNFGYVIAPEYWWTFVPVDEIDIYPSSWIVCGTR